MSRKQIILGAYLGGVNHHTAWWHPRAGSQIGGNIVQLTLQLRGLAMRQRFFAQTAEVVIEKVV